jgi:hypothetical protein
MAGKYLYSVAIQIVVYNACILETKCLHISTASSAMLRIWNSDRNFIQKLYMYRVAHAVAVLI